MTISIIPARGGSRRLPRKNVKPFCGHPLVAWTIMQSKCAHLIDKVVVSTDDDEIEEVSRAYGADIIRRPDWPDANEVSAGRPVAHAIEILMERYGDAFDTLVTPLCTQPLRKPDDFDTVIRAKRDNGFQNVTMLLPHREVMLYKRVNDFVARLAVFNKTYKYLSQACGVGAMNPRWTLTGYRAYKSDLDADIDKETEEGPGGECYYILAEPWQYADTDTAIEFDLAEVLMEHFILKGRGMKVYEDYREEKVSALSGNWRQQ